MTVVEPWMQPSTKPTPSPTPPWAANRATLLREANRVMSEHLRLLAVGRKEPLLHQDACFRWRQLSHQSDGSVTTKGDLVKAKSSSPPGFNKMHGCAGGPAPWQDQKLKGKVEKAARRSRHTQLESDKGTASGLRRREGGTLRCSTASAYLKRMECRLWHREAV